MGVAEQALKPSPASVTESGSAPLASGLTDMPEPVDHYPAAPHATKAVDRSITLFSERIRERFSVWLERSGKYLDLMKTILKANDLPEEIAFLPLIESGFNPNAYSVARAVGPWQFIAGTAKRYGLKIDWWRDERKDPVKSTEAAASYLKDLYDMFGSWNLAMAAYNAGEGKILKALNRTKSDDYWALLNTRHIRQETKEYVPRFIAAKMIATDPRSYGFENLTYHPPLRFDEVIVEQPIDLDVVARCTDADVETIKELNPELRRWSTPANVPAYTLRIPAGKRELFLSNLSDVPPGDRFTVTTYTVRKGDTLKSIAGRLGVPVDVLNELNGRIPGKLKAGETVALPPKGKFALDRDDRASAKKATYKTKKKNPGKRVLITSLPRKDQVAND